MKWKESLTLVVVLSLVGVVIAGCATPEEAADTEPAESPEPTAVVEPAFTPVPEETTLVIGRPVDSAGLDPQGPAGRDEGLVQDKIFETLVFLDNENNVHPWLATSWEPSEDNLTWTFHLRDDVTFHNGEPFNAEAVRFSIHRFLGKEPGSEKAVYYTQLAQIDHVEVVDEYTINIVMTEPFAPILRNLGHHAAGIVPPGAVKEKGENFISEPVGTGPFRFVSWVRDDSIVLEKNPDYWQEGEPTIDKLIYKVIPEGSARVAALQAGEVDFIDNVPPEAIPQIEADADLVMEIAPAQRVVFICMNVTMEPFTDIKVREAVVHAVNIEELVSSLMSDVAFVARPTFAPGVWGSDQEIPYYGYDPEKSKQLLEEAGWEMGPDGIRVKDGQPLEVTLNTTKGRYIKDEEMSLFIAEALREVGFDAKAEVVEAQLHFQTITNRGYPFYVLGAGISSGDIDFGISILFHSEASYNGFDLDDPAIDELILEARAESDTEKRMELYKEAQMMIRNQYVWLPIYYSTILQAHTDAVKGYVPNPAEHIRLWGVTIGE
jgi:peptide/nickel transport system substrate-binding protein